MKNRRASCTECHPLGNDFVTMTARVVPSRTKRLPGIIRRAKHAAVVSHRRLVLDASSLLVKSWASSNWSDALRSASFVNESRPCESRMRTLHAQPNHRQIGVLRFQLEKTKGKRKTNQSVSCSLRVAFIATLVATTAGS